MKNRTVLMAVVGSSICAGAMADYTGLSWDIVSLEDEMFTVRLYADFDAATDELDAVFGDAENDLYITSTNGFYQNDFGGATSADINPALYSAFPSLVRDSWVTIGLEDQVDNNMLNIGIDFADFEDNGGDIYTDNGTWFATPDDAQVLAGADLRVMVGQFTMLGDPNHGGGGLTGVINIQGKHGNFETFQVRDIYFDFSVPSPSAIALLGIAGLAQRRRK